MKYNVFRIGKHVYAFQYTDSKQLYNCSYCAFYKNSNCTAGQYLKHYCKDNAYYKKVV